MSAVDSHVFRTEHLSFHGKSIILSVLVTHASYIFVIRKVLS